MIADASALGGYRVEYQRMQVCQALVDSYELVTTKEHVHHDWKTSVLERQRFIFHPPIAALGEAENKEEPNEQAVLADDGKKKKASKKDAVTYDDKWLTDEGLRSLLNRYEEGNYHAIVQGIRDALVAAFLHSPFENDRRVRRKVEADRQRIRNGLAATGVAEYATCKITVWKTAPTKDDYMCRNLDMWCPALYIHVECDEHDHVAYPAGYRELRRRDITDVYSDRVVFHSFNPHAPDFAIDAQIVARRTIVQLFNTTKDERAANPQEWANKIEDDKIKIAAAAKAAKAKREDDAPKKKKADKGEDDEEDKEENNVETDNDGTPAAAEAASSVQVAKAPAGK